MATVTNTIHSVDLTAAIGGAPSAGDQVNIDRYQDSYTAGLSLGGTNLLGVLFGPGWSGNIEDAPFQFECNGASRRVRCQSSSRKLKIGSSALAKIFTSLEVAMALGAKGQVEVSLVTVTLATVVSGSLLVRDSAEVTAIRMDGGAATIEATGTAAAVTTVTVNEGSLRIDRDLTNATIRGGQLLIDHESVSPSGTVTMNGGTVTVRLHGGTIGTLTMHRGTLDLSGVSTPLTISAVTLGSRGTCRVIMPQDRTLITWTSVTLDGIGDPREN